MAPVAGRRYFPRASHVLFLPPLLLPFLLSFLFLGLPPLAAAAAGTPPHPMNTTQEAIMRDVLRLLRSESVGVGWNLTASTPCQWEAGITCNVSGSGSGSLMVVTGIILQGYSISNPSIFSSICRLDTLRILDLSGNYFTNLPFASSSCPMKEALQSLNLSSNRLTNSLSDLVGFSQLQVLDLSFNRFYSGNLSSDLSTFSRLRSLNLSSNNFRGDVPASMVRSLEDLVLSRNYFSGGVPEGLFEYRNLTTLDLSQNYYLTGHVPDNFTKLMKLQTLILSANNLSGRIPKSLTEVRTLSRFSANQNGFTGWIPSGITRHLKMLDLSYNSLSGTIPSDLLSYPALETIDLTSNKLLGNIPPIFSSDISRIRLSNNSLNGSIPESIGNAWKLAYLELDGNQLSGGIVSQLGKCKRLALLNLASNNLPGPIPDEISTLSELVVLKFQNNILNGSIPRAFSALSKLSILNLSRNSLTGEIPQGIVQLTMLTNLNLEDNRISGIIPTSISLLTKLIELNLGNNNLNGMIPLMPVSLSTSLNLSHNNLSGSFPSNIGYLKDLEILDLSYNNLSGPVPSSLANLQSLTQLMLAYNQFSGPVPALAHAHVNTTGNPGIINTDGTDNNHISTGRWKNHTMLFITFVLICLGLCFASVISLSLSKINYCHGGVEPSTRRDEWQILPFHTLDFGDEVIPKGLIEENLIGCGGSGHVYRIAYTNRYYGSSGLVAVKQIWSTDRDEELEREFKSEARILGNIRHQNIIRLLCCLSGAESKLLVYDYMHNGSLDNWLHGHPHCVRHSMSRMQSVCSVPLDWPTRLTVAVGAAQGLCYMHHYCSPPIIHRDIKTSNILLDSEFRAKIADFGLARMLVRVGEPNTMSKLAGSFGYMAPECAYTSKVGEKVDVYGFGVVLLELATGKKAKDGGEHGCLAEWAWHHYRSGADITDAIDKAIRYAGYHGEIETVFRLGVKCTGNSPSSRPNMKVVLQILLKCSEHRGDTPENHNEAWSGV